MIVWQEEFVAAWNSSDSLDEFLAAYPRPIKRRSASAMASDLRRQGYSLKSFVLQRGNQHSAQFRAEAIDRLRQKGATFQEIADAAGVSRQAIYAVYAKGKKKG